MKIIPFDKRYLDEMIHLFIEVYSEPKHEWDYQTTEAYLYKCYQGYPHYCFVALKESKILGGIFCYVTPYYKNKGIIIESLQVKLKERGKGVGKALLSTLLEKAKEDGLRIAQLSVDVRKNFPMEWYEKIGFRKSNWVELEMEL